MPINTPGEEKANPSPDLAQQHDVPVAELARLIRTHLAVRRAVPAAVMRCPNIKWEMRTVLSVEPCSGSGR